MSAFNKSIGIVIALCAAANVAKADGNPDDKVEVKGFEAQCYDYIRQTVCEHAPNKSEAKPAAAPASDPKVATLEGQVSELKKQVDAMHAVDPAKAKAAADRRKARTELADKVRKLEQQVAELAKPAKPGAPAPDHGQEIADMLKQLAELGERVAKDDVAHDDNEMALKDQIDALSKRVDQRPGDHADGKRPIEFGFYLAPAVLSTSKGATVSYLALTPQLGLPFSERFSLTLEASPLLANDRQPFGGQTREGIDYAVAARAVLAFGFSQSFVGYDSGLKARAVLFMGDVGVRWHPISVLDCGFNIFLGDGIVGGKYDPVMGVRGLFGFRLPK